MEHNHKESSRKTMPTAMQSTSTQITRPKLTISACFVLLLIVILLEIYAPRSKTAATDENIQPASAPAPAVVEPRKDRALDEHQ